MYDGNVVEVRKQFSNDPTLPLITLDLSGGVSTEYSYRKLEGIEKYCFCRTANININVWCNTEEEREVINNRILELFYLEQTNHYMFCANYDDGNCSTLNHACKVGVVDNERTRKDRCPYPDTYEYEGLSKVYGIIPGTINIELPFDLDINTEHPPVLRSVLRAKATYHECVRSIGEPDAEVGFDDITIY